VLGGNGAGKTSLLEAIYVLATTRSFRAAQLADCIHHGSDGFRIVGEVATDRRATLEVSVRGGARERLVNGKATSLAEHLAVLPVVAWTAAEAEVLVGAPRARRRFMDRGIVGTRPAALEVIGRYREALRAKRDLLAGETTHLGLVEGAPAGLEVWNELLASAAAELIARREAYLVELAGALARTIETAGLPLPAIELRYRPSPPRGAEGTAAIASALERIADRERRRQHPLLGPHRDELEILWDGHDLRRVASAGERKALSLLLVAAHGRVLEEAGRPPTYLLDDADAELAPATLSAVWKAFGGARQVVASSNRPQAWLTLEVGTLWEMEKGRIRPL
jgi:DNA replication and repair protein RecF